MMITRRLDFSGAKILAAKRLPQYISVPVCSGGFSFWNKQNVQTSFFFKSKLFEAVPFWVFQNWFELFGTVWLSKSRSKDSPIASISLISFYCSK